MGGERVVRSDPKNVCARTHLVPPCVRISGQRDVSHANDKTQQSKLKKNTPVVPAAAFAGHSTAAAFSWLSSGGREEERRQGVSITVGIINARTYYKKIKGTPLTIQSCIRAVKVGGGRAARSEHG